VNYIKVIRAVSEYKQTRM